jgi:enoyl-CoA hydratase/carnithine racemase
MHAVWPEVIGSVSGRYFLLTRQELDTATAKAWEAVNEIVEQDQLMDRARAIAANLAELLPLTTHYTRIEMTQRLRRLIEEGSATAWDSKESARQRSPNLRRPSLRRPQPLAGFGLARPPFFGFHAEARS